MKGLPRLSIGLPVYNGEAYLAESLTALLTQSFTDFELIISDNASTDGTQDICRYFEAEDDRIRYIRQARNIGAAPNHNFVFAQARAAYFKWASHDDLYHRDLLQRCVEVLDSRSDVVLVHSFEAFIDVYGDVIAPVDYTLATDSPSASRRFRALLFGIGGDDFYGVIRSDTLRRTAMHDSYHNADRTITAEIALHGPFLQVPEIMYFRRDHPARAERATTVRLRAANLDPKRADRLRNPLPRLLVEYVWGYVTAIFRAPLSARDRLACLGHLAHWMISRGALTSSRQNLHSVDPALRAKAEAKHRSKSTVQCAGQATRDLS